MSSSPPNRWRNPIRRSARFAPRLQVHLRLPRTFEQSRRTRPLARASRIARSAMSTLPKAGALDRSVGRSLELDGRHLARHCACFGSLSARNWRATVRRRSTGDRSHQSSLALSPLWTHQSYQRRDLPSRTPMLHPRQGRLSERDHHLA